MSPGTPTHAEQEAVKQAWQRFSRHAHGTEPPLEHDDVEAPPLPGECGRCLRARQLLTEPGWDSEAFAVAWEIACEVGRPHLEAYQIALAVLGEMYRASRRPAPVQVP